MRTGIAPRPDAVPRPTVGRRLRIGTAIASALVLVLTGGAWGLYRNVTAGITTTDVIRGGSSDGAQNILLVGVDSREDAQGNPLPQSVLDQLHGGPDTGVLNSDTIIVLHVPAGGGAAVAFSIPRDAYVDIPGYRRDKINAAYPAMKAIAEQQLHGRRRAGPPGDRRGGVRARAHGVDRRGRGPHRAHDRPLRRDQPRRLRDADRGHRRRAGVPRGAHARRALRRATSPRASRRSPAPRRSRSSANATACRRATCRASAASRCSSPRRPRSCSRRAR